MSLGDLLSLSEPQPLFHQTIIRVLSCGVLARSDEAVQGKGLSPVPGTRENFDQLERAGSKRKGEGGAALCKFLIPPFIRNKCINLNGVKFQELTP